MRCWGYHFLNMIHNFYLRSWLSLHVLSLPRRFGQWRRRSVDSPSPEQTERKGQNTFGVTGEVWIDGRLVHGNSDRFWVWGFGDHSPSLLNTDLKVIVNDWRGIRVRNVWFRGIRFGRKHVVWRVVNSSSATEKVYSASQRAQAEKKSSRSQKASSKYHVFSKMTFLRSWKVYERKRQRRREKKASRNLALVDDEAKHFDFSHPWRFKSLIGTIHHVYQSLLLRLRVTIFV